MCTFCFANFTNCSFRSARYLLVGAFLVTASCVVVAAQVEAPVQAEVFTISDRNVVGLRQFGINDRMHGVDVRIYELNEILRVEVELTSDLPADPEKSKRMTLQRIQRLDEQIRSRMQSAAHGMAKAMQYGIDRIPAIVFDGQSVVYGVTDLQAAIAYYQTWQTMGQP